MADIFLSYATADWPRAKVLKDWFERLGWSVFVDRETRHGEPWAEHIEAELKAAKCVVVFWSSAAFESEWVLREATLAHEIERLVQVKGTGLDAPEPFCTLQMFRFEAWAGENDVPEKQAFLEEVAGRLGRDVPKAEVVKTLAVPPAIHRFEVARAAFHYCAAQVQFNFGPAAKTEQTVEGIRHAWNELERVLGPRPDGDNDLHRFAKPFLDALMSCQRS